MTNGRKASILRSAMPDLSPKTLVGGIDEAGYAPRLGPLAVTAWFMRCRAVGDDLYRLLAPVVVRPGRGKGGARRESLIEVGDSKAVYSPRRGLARLETGVLTFLGAVLPEARETGGLRRGPGEWPKAAEGLTDLGLISRLTSSSSGPGCDLSGLEWYGGPPEALPVEASRGAVEEASGRLREKLASAGVCHDSVRSRLVTAAELNSLVAAGLNKAEVLLEVVRGLLSETGTREGPSHVPVCGTVTVDRLGGRLDYRGLLAGAFPGAEVEELSRTSSGSSYRVRLVMSGEGGGLRTDLRVLFASKADASSFPVGLASMVSKYLRELLMRRLNRFFTSRMAGLAPTAGYPVDAARFLDETAGLRKRAGIDDEKLIRVR